MSKLTDLSMAKALAGLKAGDFTALELTEDYIANCLAQRHLNCYITETFDLARQQARIADEKYRKGEAGLMEGMPVAIKDLFCTDGVKTTAGSHILSNFVPNYESSVSENLWRAGAVMLGKSNLDQFGMGSANTNSHFGAVINPWKRHGDNMDLVPGGSSGGSAAAVAAHIAIAATGTDTGGSIRQPASFTGITGLKPTYGRCSRYGLIAFASSLDQAGPMTRDVRDAAIMLQAMAGFDPKDSTSVDRPVPDYQAAFSGDIRGLKIGIPREYRLDGMPVAIEKLWQQGKAWLEDRGAVCVDVSLPHSEHALAAYYIVAPAEASSNLARYDGVRYGLRVSGADLTEMYENTRAEGFGAEVKRRVMIGTYVLSSGYYDAYYLKAQKVRSLIARDFTQAFDQVDVLLTPATPSAAFAIGAHADDPLKMYLNDIFTVPTSLAGLPAISVPSGLDEAGLPLGLQLIGKPFDEGNLLNVAYVLEAQANFP